MVVKRGDIFDADLGVSDNAGSEQQGKRPVVIIQNDIGNTYSPTVIVAAVTSKISKEKKKSLPVHVELVNGFLEKKSIVLLEQIRTLDKSKLRFKIGQLDYLELEELNRALKVSVGL